MITLKSEREIQAMEESGAILAGVHEELRGFIKPGLTTMEINNFVQSRIEVAGAICEQIGFEGYEFATCTSVNDEICHGFPGKYVLKDGDLIKVEMVANYNGAMSDSCWSDAVGEATPEVKRLMEVTEKALYLGIEQAKVGNRVGDIGHAIQTYVEGEGFSVVREFIGHGIGPTDARKPIHSALRRCR